MALSENVIWSNLFTMTLLIWARSIQNIRFKDGPWRLNVLQRLDSIRDEFLDILEAFKDVLRIALFWPQR